MGTERHQRISLAEGDLWLGHAGPRCLPITVPLSREIWFCRITTNAGELTCFLNFYQLLINTCGIFRIRIGYQYVEWFIIIAKYFHVCKRLKTVALIIEFPSFSSEEARWSGHEFQSTSHPRGTFFKNNFLQDWYGKTVLGGEKWVRALSLTFQNIEAYIKVSNKGALAKRHLGIFLKSKDFLVWAIQCDEKSQNTTMAAKQ